MNGQEKLLPPPPKDAIAHTVTGLIPGTGVEVTGTYYVDPALLEPDQDPNKARTFAGHFQKEEPVVPTE